MSDKSEKTHVPDLLGNLARSVADAGGEESRKYLDQSETTQPVRVGFRYSDGEVLSPEREAVSEDEELPTAVIDLGDGEWLTLADLRAIHHERLERALDSWDDDVVTPPAVEGGSDV